MSPELQAALQLRAKESHRCYDKALATDAKLQGKIVIEVWVAADGAACTTRVASVDRDLDAVAGCVRGYFDAASYPAPPSGCVSVRVPINFIPKK